MTNKDPNFIKLDNSWGIHCTDDGELSLVYNNTKDNFILNMGELTLSSVDKLREGINLIKTDGNMTTDLN